MFAAHFICFQPGRFGIGRAVCDACRQHTRAQDRPIACRSFPNQAVALQAGGYIQYLIRIDRQGWIVSFRLYRPLIFVPVGERCLEHLGQCLFRIAFHSRAGRKDHLAQTASGSNSAQFQTKLVGGCSRDRHHDRCIGVKAHIRVGIEAVYHKFGYRPETVILLHLQPCCALNGMVSRIDLKTAQGKRLVRLEINCDGPVAFLCKKQSRLLVSVQQSGKVLQGKRGRYFRV